MPDKSVITMREKRREKKKEQDRLIHMTISILLQKQIFSPLDCNSVHKYLMKMATTFLIIPVFM